MGIRAAAGEEVPGGGCFGPEIAQDELVREVDVRRDEHSRLGGMADAVHEVIEHQRTRFSERGVGRGRLHPNAVVLALVRARVEESAPSFGNAARNEDEGDSGDKCSGRPAKQEGYGHQEQRDRAQNENVARPEVLNQPEPCCERAGDAAKRSERMHRAHDTARAIAAPPARGW